MKNFLAVSGLVGALSLLTSAAYADGSKCVSLDNDIARLACFDEAYRGTEASDLTPIEAFEALAELVEFEGPKERLILTASEDRCTLNVLYEGFILSDSLDRPYQMNSYINLSTVESLGFWRGIGDWSGGLRGIIAFTDRTSTGAWRARAAKQWNGSLTTLDQLNFYALPELNSYEGRDAAIYLLIEDYRPDADKVEKALWDAILACGGGKSS
jgi:hypothetical protein